tara:strand:+ start:517 stop:744 length:228 start_codon:yes stop_codon:yes gene_type:complete
MMNWNYIDKKDRTQDPDAYVPEKGYTYRYRWYKQDVRNNPKSYEEGPHKHYPVWQAALDSPENKARVKSFIKGGG